MGAAIQRLRRAALALLALGALPAAAQLAPLAASALLRPSQLAVVVNEAAPGSREVGEYYLHARGIPAQNLVRLNFPAAAHRLDFAEFENLRGQIDAQLSHSVKAVLFVWTTPYAVGCNALTAAYTLGAEPALCAATCSPSRPSPFFASPGAPRPGGQRLSMLLPVESVAQAEALIDRGVASDGSRPRGKAIFVKTADGNRNTRAGFFPPSRELFDPALSIRRVEGEGIAHEDGIMLYEIGAVSVPHLETLGFLPGALADHLTSAGGDLLGGSQMSSLRWLEAGATASYGTVSEPCNYWQKFPHPARLLAHYLAGESALEAYWHSVAWPAQGLFIGEPLAAPYRHRPGSQAD